MNPEQGEPILNRSHAELVPSADVAGRTVTVAAIPECGIVKSGCYNSFLFLPYADAVAGMIFKISLQV